MIHLLGFGSIGRLMAMQSPDAYAILAKPNQKPQPQCTQVALKQGRAIHFSYPQIHLGEAVRIDKLLICVKAYQVLDAITPWLPHLSDQAQICLLHNGMGTIEQISPLLGPSQTLLAATTSKGAYINLNNQLVHEGGGETHIGWASGPQLTHHSKKDWLDALQAQWSDNILAILWRKLAINCAINPLTAAHDCLNGELAKPKFRATIDAIVDEFCQIAQPESIAFSRGEIMAVVDKVIHNTASNSSSMRQDIRNNRATEIDYINGFLLQKASKSGFHAENITNYHNKISKLTKQG